MLNATKKLACGKCNTKHIAQFKKYLLFEMVVSI